MIIVDDCLVSEDLFKEEFLCNLSSCKGACCVEGDKGAPLNQEDIDSIQNNIDSIKPYLDDEAQSIIENIGFYETDVDGEPVTNCKSNQECVFANRVNGILSCGIEQSQKEGKHDYIKPISCHLYPIRENRYGDYHVLNYHQWSICEAACQAGKNANLKVFQFLKDPLIRRFGSDWYKKLVAFSEK